MASTSERLGPFTREMSLPQMVMYAGATWDWHRLHYDPEFATRARLEGPIVDGQLLGALFAEQVVRHFGPAARLREMDLRFRSMVYVGETVEVTGEVTGRDLADHGEVVTCNQVIAAGARTAATATTTLVVPMGASG